MRILSSLKRPDQARRRLEASLLEVQERYRTMFEDAPIGVTHTDFDGRFLRVNDRFCEILGRRPDEILGRTAFEFAHPDDGPVSTTLFLDVITGRRRTARYERRYLRPDGKLIRARVTIWAMRDADGSADHVIGLVEDVTEELSAREKSRIQAQLLDSVDQAVVATDLAGIVTYWNRAAERMFGWSAEEAVGSDLLELTIPVGDTETLDGILGAQLLRRHAVIPSGARDDTRGEPHSVFTGESWSGEMTLTRRNGTTFPAWVVDAPLLAENGETIGVVGIADDITEQKRNTNALRAHKVQLAEAQEITGVGSWTYNLETGEAEWSDALVRLWGFEPGAVLTLEAAYERVHPDDVELVRRIYGDARATRFAKNVDFRIRRGGAERMLSASVRPVFDDSGKATQLIGVIQDVTERNRIEKELRRRTVQQAAVANLGQLALSAASTEFLLDQAAASVAAVVGADFGQIRHKVGDDYVVVARGGTEEAPDDAERNATTVPIYCSDGATIWGTLGVHSSSRDFTSSDADFLRSVSTVLGQAMDRARADAEIAARVRQQGAIAQLGTMLLTSVAADVYERACSLLSYGLAADYALFTELTPDHTLRIVAGRMWTDDLPNEIVVSPATQSGATVLSGKPIVVDDYRVETRFDTWKGTVPHGILSGLMVPVKSGLQTLGVLSAQSAVAHHFRDEDIDFMQSVANMLADAMDRERGRQALQDSEKRYRRIFDGATEMIFHLDAEGRFVLLNPAFEMITGWSRHEWLGRSFEELVHPDDRAATTEQVQKMMQTSQPSTMEFTLLGQRRHVIVEVSSFPQIVDGTVVEIYGFARDVSATRRATEEQKKLEAKLEQAHRLSSLGRLAATVAHEFNNVLMGISPFVEVLRRTPNQDRIDAALGHIGTSVKRGRRITEDILRFTQPAEPVRVSVDVSECVFNVVTEMRPLLPERIAIHVDCDRLHIEADPNQLHQIITNLVLNARDAMTSGGKITITARSESADARFPFGVVDDPSRHAHLTVRDTGSGMSEETLRHAFEPLFTTKKSGTGLGLAVTHQVVRNHGGEIFIESKEGEGTAFHLFLPLQMENTLVSIPEGAGERPMELDALEILLVEDDAAVAAGLTAVLEGDGFFIRLAPTGRAALEALRSSLPSVVLLDVGLPDMEGTAVYDQIALLYPNLPVIFSTGHGDRSQLEDVLALPNVTYLLKPYDFDTLLDAIAKVIPRTS